MDKDLCFRVTPEGSINPLDSAIQVGEEFYERHVFDGNLEGLACRQWQGIQPAWDDRNDVANAERMQNGRVVGGMIVCDIEAPRDFSCLGREISGFRRHSV